MSSNLLHFVIPPYGVEFADAQAVIRSWTGNGLTMTTKQKCELSDNEIMFTPAQKAGGVATIRSGKRQEACMLEIGGRMMARGYPRGTSCGNEDAVRLRPLRTDYSPGADTELVAVKSNQGTKGENDF